MAQDKEVTANRTYKSSVFIMVFQEKKELLELYNAVSGKHYEDPEELEINTLDNAIYMSIKNDLSFIIDSRLSLYEHQSTYNPNLPIRYLLYVADIYSKMTLHKDIYGSMPLSIPAPQFVIFYNGEQEMPEREIMRLSSLYTVKEERPKLELETVMLNIRPGHNQRLMEASRTFTLSAASPYSNSGRALLTSGFYRNPSSSFSSVGCFSVAFSGKKDPKKGAVEVVGNPFSASSKCIFHMAGI